MWDSAKHIFAPPPLKLCVLRIAVGIQIRGGGSFVPPCGSTRARLEKNEEGPGGGGGQGRSLGVVGVVKKIDGFTVVTDRGVGVGGGGPQGGLWHTIKTDGGRGRCPCWWASNFFAAYLFPNKKIETRSVPFGG